MISLHVGTEKLNFVFITLNIIGICKTVCSYTFLICAVFFFFLLNKKNVFLPLISFLAKDFIYGEWTLLCKWREIFYNFLDAAGYQFLATAYYDQNGQLVMGNPRGIGTPVRLVSPAPVLVNTGNQQGEKYECYSF